MSCKIIRKFVERMNTEGESAINVKPDFYIIGNASSLGLLWNGGGLVPIIDIHQNNMKICEKQIIIQFDDFSNLSDEELVLIYGMVILDKKIIEYLNNIVDVSISDFSKFLRS